MSDEPEPNQVNTDDDRMADAWRMPKPVFRSSEGTTPKNVRPADDPADLHETPTLDDDETEVEVPGKEPSPKPMGIRAAAPKPRKGGCALSVFAITTLVALAAGGVVIALIYWFYLSPPPDPFSH
jgi:hypothetical protein